MNRRPLASVRWRITVMFLLLVFVAMSVLSVFLLQRMEDDQLSALRTNITRTVRESGILGSLDVYPSLSDGAASVQELLNDSWAGSFSEEISVVDAGLRVCASTNPVIVRRPAADIFDAELLSAAVAGTAFGESRSLSGDIPVRNFCFYVGDPAREDFKGLVYVRADLTSIEDMLSRSRLTFIEGTVVALAVTFLLGLILSRTITDPIKAVTKSAEKISAGSFETVSVRSDDEIGRLAAVFNDMQERLDATLAEISNEKSKMETMLRYMADGLLAIDLKGNIIHANPAFRDMLGISELQDLSQVSSDELLSGLSEDLTLEKLKEGCHDGGGQTVFSAAESVFAVRYDRFKDESGGDAGIIILLQDITERQKLEDMQTDFVANVSHELKTPLTNVKSYTETLLDGAIEDRDTAVRFLGIIDSEADRMNRLVKDLLQLSRLDHNQDQLSLKESNLISVLDLSVTKMRLAAEQKKLQLFTLYNEDGDIRVNIDRDRMEQVLLNVISNAVKYTDEGGRIDVDAFETGRTARIIVSDNGIGISEAALPRIFERFYRVDKARSRAMGGTGLGLAITKQLVEQHGGSIEAESAEGKGTKIIISLPLANRKGIRNIE